jgi:hypothetical protein
MPKQYEAMRDKFAGDAEVDSPAYNRAQSKAAAIYNSKHKKKPVTGKKSKKAKKKAKKGAMAGMLSERFAKGGY